MFLAISGEIMGSTYKVINNRTKFFELFREDAHFCHNTVIMASSIEIIKKYKSHDLSSLDKNQISHLYKSKMLSYMNRGFGAGQTQIIYNGNLQSYQSIGNSFLSRLVCLPYLYKNELISLTELYYWIRTLIKLTHSEDICVDWGYLFVELMLQLQDNPKDYENIILKFSKKFNISIIPLIKLINRAGNNVSVSHTMTVVLSSIYYAHDAEDSITNVISMGGDTDTFAFITGALSELIWGRNSEWENKNLQYFKPFDRWIIDTLHSIY